jgi:hypothetical protein
MNAPNRPIRPVTQPRIRIYHAHALTVRLGSLTPHAILRMERRIARSAVSEMASLKRGLEISYHPFEVAGWPLVLSSRWSQRSATLVIAVDLKPWCGPSITLVDPVRLQHSPRRRERLTSRSVSRSRC